MGIHEAGLRHWIDICLIVAAICTTAFPLLYSFSPWYRSSLGRALMLQALAFAVAVDFITVFHFWKSRNIMLRLWIFGLSFTLIAASGAILTWMLWITNHRNRKLEKGVSDERRLNG